MRPQLNLRAGAVPALGALAITSTLSAGGAIAAAAAGPAGVASAQTQGVAATVSSPHVGYRKPAVVVGRVADGQPGQALALQFQARGAATWQTVATGLSGRAGSYRLSARLERSGSLRVIADSGALRTDATAASTATAPGSSAQAIYVGAGIVAHTRQRDVLNGGAITVTGALRPLTADAGVELQEREGHRWVTLARTRTGARGRYRLRFRPRGTGSPLIRVRYAGGAINDASTQRLGAVNVYRLAGASWYGPGGSLACGGTLTSGTLGVANKTLPCGTLVTLRYGNRRVRVPVVDRGPYVAGRDYDLTPATKAALGFGDTGTIWATR